MAKSSSFSLRRIKFPSLLAIFAIFSLAPVVHAGHHTHASDDPSQPAKMDEGGSEMPGSASAGKEGTTHLSNGSCQVESMGFPIDASINNVLVSDDDQHVAVLGMIGSRKVMFVDGKPGPKFDDIQSPASAPAEFAWSKGGGKFAYVGMRGGAYIIVADGAPTGTYAQAFSLQFAGERLVAVVKSDDGKMHVVVDGNVGPDCTNVEYLHISPDGNHIAYVDSIASNSAQLYVDEQPPVKFNTISDLRYSKDSQQLTYVATVPGESFSSSCHFYINGKPGIAYQSISDVTYSHNGDRVAYLAVVALPDEHTSSTVLVIDGKSRPRPDSTFSLDRSGTLVFFSPDDKHIIWGQTLGGKACIVLDGVPSLGYDGIAKAVFSPDSSRLAYVGYAGPKSFLVEGDNEVELGTGASTDASKSYASFSPDSKHLFYHDFQKIIIDGKIVSTDIAYSAISSNSDIALCSGSFAARTITLNGQLIATLKGNPRSMAFSPDAKNFFYAMDLDNSFQTTYNSQTAPIINGMMIAGPWFSADSKHVAYYADIVEGQAHSVCLIVDGNRGDPFVRIFKETGVQNPYQETPTRPFNFNADNTITYFAAGDAQIYRVTQTITPASSNTTTVQNTPIQDNNNPNTNNNPDPNAPTPQPPQPKRSNNPFDNAQHLLGQNKNKFKLPFSR